MTAPSAIGRFVSVVKRIAGMPDYAGYVAHLRYKHPECRVPSESEYYEMYLEGLYSGVGGRCC
ncbi:MAG: CstA-like transporter-associated (seleno)protein [Gemmatimonadaceae bacterium]